MVEGPEAHEAIANAKTFIARAGALDKLTVYTQRIVSQSQKTLKELQDLQAKRKALKSDQRFDAIRFYKFHKMMDLPFEPKEHGFVFSRPEIHAEIRRQALDNNVGKAKECGFDRDTYVKKFPDLAA